MIEEGFDVLYVSSCSLISEFEKKRFGGAEDTDTSRFYSADLLIIDDFGAELSNQFTISCLYNLINTRQNKGLCTIISTNLSAEELAGKYEGRIYSRIIGADYTVLRFEGNDHRISR